MRRQSARRPRCRVRHRPVRAAAGAVRADASSGVDLSRGHVEARRREAGLRRAGAGRADRVSAAVNTGGSTSIVSADTLVYFGALEAVAAAAAASAAAGRPAGLHRRRGEWTRRSRESYRIRPHGRYTHGADYVRAAARRASDWNRTSGAPSCAWSPACRLPAWSSAPQAGARRSATARGDGRAPWLESWKSRRRSAPTCCCSTRMHAREELSRVGEYQLDLLSLKHDINLDQILGKNVTVKLALQDDGTRYFNGYVTRFSQGGMHGRYRRYYATVHPWLWFLTPHGGLPHLPGDDAFRTSSRRCSASTRRPRSRTSSPARTAKWTYCVQYRETDLNFVCRLMEQEGIYFYFTHDDGQAHAGAWPTPTAAHAPFQGEPVPFIDPDAAGPARHRAHQRVEPDARDPARRLRARRLRFRAAERRAADAEGGVAQLHAERLRDLRLSRASICRRPTAKRRRRCASTSSRRSSRRRRRATNVRTVSVGSPVHAREVRRATIRTASTWWCRRPTTWSSATTRRCRSAAAPTTGAASWRCRASSSSGRARLTPKPFVQGPQTAVVVGPAGEEIYTDKYGRVKVQFHWDREGKKDENSSCWVRVSQPWAGKAWGGVAIPRIGQEVIVDFLEGDPDQPIITGRVYNAEQMPPYALPANKTQTGIKSRSSHGRHARTTSTRSASRTRRASEQLFIHAEKNQDIEVENDETHWVGHDRKKTIDNDETTHVKHDRTETVDNNETITIHGNRTETVDKDETITHQRQPHRDCREERDDHDRQEPHRERRRERKRRHRQGSVDHRRRQPQR